ncbi:para-aminobenzoate synthetase / 4-amino-4-deoxychorismate lyase [Sphingomonas palmae]|uniref:Probable branched-chain-amino-acid aminotransferase n=1 Tax=Sphingomonas palmae TaxID=1855283 RepID=A0A1H7SCI1_9SPHN|nr:aminodeoxychorismate synthase component I [Sphingomonas palmae]SEL69444.1 para-aminobenzoate synthetase / 4-amino-4-deoxychorismate lyase [Sphingomonas palmae]
MRIEPPYVLLDDARDGGAPARLYRHPLAVLTAYAVDEIAPLLEAVRAHRDDAAGFVSYEASGAFEPAAAAARVGDAPLAWFGLFDGYEHVDVPALLPDPAGAWIGPLEPRVTRAEYDAMFARVQALIAAGDLYQANLTFRADLAVAGDPLALYARLRAATRGGWSAIVATGEATFLSFSPELFFALEGDRLTCRPMKGTAPRLPDRHADAAAAAALASDPKQRAENLMIVDLMRNDLSRVAVAGSVAVPELFALERYPTVHQMTSTVTATRAAGVDAVDVLAALFPCGSITGAPKVRAIQALDGIEADARGLYTGAIGRIDANGDAMFNVAIRTLALSADGTGATIGLGGGIVADSTAVAEWDEALAKGTFLSRGERSFDLIETMAFDPMEGITLIERHLSRVKDGAAALGFAFDRHDARNELQAATFRLREPARVRMLLAKSGALAIQVSPLPASPMTPLRVAVVPLPVSPADWRLRHKTSDRAFYDTARRASGCDEVVFVAPDGTLTEGSYTSLFVERGGVLLTPPAGPLLPGVLRAELLATGRAREAVLRRDDLADGFLLGNALRGLMPARLVTGHPAVAK